MTCVPAIGQPETRCGRRSPRTCTRCWWSRRDRLKGLGRMMATEARGIGCWRCQHWTAMPVAAAESRCEALRRPLMRRNWSAASLPAASENPAGVRPKISRPSAQTPGPLPTWLAAP